MDYGRRETTEHGYGDGYVDGDGEGDGDGNEDGQTLSVLTLWGRWWQEINAFFIAVEEISKQA